MPSSAAQAPPVHLKTNILFSRLFQLYTDYTTAQTGSVRKEVAYNSARAGELEAAQVCTCWDLHTPIPATRTSAFLLGPRSLWRP